MEQTLDVFDKDKDFDRPKLKSCPFCGGKGEVKFVNAKNVRAFKVKCTMCGSESNLYHVKWQHSALDGIEEWNKNFSEPIKKCADAWNTRVKNN